MKKNILTILFLTSCFFSYSQKELWGVNSTESYVDYSNPSAPVTVPYLGNISKYDINGLNPTIIHEFTDFATGKKPKGKLFLASNGKLYGITWAGGNTIPSNPDGVGTLYEYDLILDKYRVVHYFDYTYGSLQPQSGMIEPIVGKLYGSVGTRIFSYDLNTELFSFVSGAIGGNVNNELMKASNGFLYGTTGYLGNCPGTTPILPNYGTLFKVNTTTNTVQTVHYFNCNGSDGLNIGTNSGTLIEFQQGKLLGTVTGDFGTITRGLLFEFDTTTNTFTKKTDFDANNPDGYNLGYYPMMMVNNSNGKLYGVCQQGGAANITINGTNIITHSGTVFEYTPTTNVLNNIYNFLDGGMTYAGLPFSIMKASTGYYFGISSGGIYKFDSTNNTTISPCYPYTACPTPAPNAGVTESLIEICRKPSYHEFVIDTFTPPINTPFSFNVQNTNATSYIWKKDNVVLPTQTTGILNFTNVTSSDSGTYTCTMTNECGTTVTMPLHLNVGALGTEDFSQLDNAITLFPNPTNNILNINIYQKSNIEISKITITNLLGQIVLNEEKNNTKIDVSKFASGLYQIKLTTNKGIWSGKFIKD